MDHPGIKVFNRITENIFLSKFRINSHNGFIVQSKNYRIPVSNIVLEIEVKCNILCLDIQKKKQQIETRINLFMR